VDDAVFDPFALDQFRDAAGEVLDGRACLRVCHRTMMDFHLVGELDDGEIVERKLARDGMDGVLERDAPGSPRITRDDHPDLRSRPDAAPIVDLNPVLPQQRDAARPSNHG
jgi:hypothetical protein